MGKQINFYMDEEVQNRFIEYLSECGFLTIGVDTMAVSVTSSSVFSVYLYKENYGALVYSKNLENQVDSIRSPVIQFRKTIIKKEQQRILRGRLWLEDKYYAEDGSIVQKDKELEKDYRKLVRWIKKNVPYRKITKGNLEVSEYASQSYDELLKDGFIFTL